MKNDKGHTLKISTRPGTSVLDFGSDTVILTRDKNIIIRGRKPDQLDHPVICINGDFVVWAGSGSLGTKLKTLWRVIRFLFTDKKAIKIH